MPKFKTFWKFGFRIWDLFEIWFLLFGILGQFMNADPVKKINNALGSVRLSPSEKSRVRGILASRLSARRNFWSPLLRPWVAALIIVILVAGGGTSLAAEQSLPGEPLYAVKVGLNEPVRGWLVFNDQARADWQAERVARRLQEMSALEKAGRLPPPTRQNLAARLQQREMREQEQAFKRHVAAMNQRFKRRQRGLNAVTQTAVRDVLSEIEAAHQAGLKAREQGEAQMALQEYRNALQRSQRVFILINTR